MERCKPYLAVIIAVVLFFTCDSKQGTLPNEKILGKWHYVDFPNIYIEVGESSYTEYMGSSGSSVVYDLRWEDSLHFELEVKRIVGLNGKLRLHDKIQIEIKEITANYYRFNLQFKNESHCILAVRVPGYTGPTGTPC